MQHHIVAMFSSAVGGGSCADASVHAAECFQVGGFARLPGLGIVQLFHRVAIGVSRDVAPVQPGPGCQRSSTTGSLSGSGWQASFGGAGTSCPARHLLSYTVRFDGGGGRFAAASGTARLVFHDHGTIVGNSETLSGSLISHAAVPAFGPGSPYTAYGDRPEASSGCGRVSPVPVGRTASESLAADPVVADGATRRSYWVHVPTGYAPTRPVPVLLDFHGHGGWAASQATSSGFSELADLRDFLAVYPQGLSYDGSPDWADDGRIDAGVDDMWFTSDLLDALQQSFCVNPARIYATGFSAGGGMIKYLICTLAGRIAAFAAVSADLYQPPGGCHPSRPVSVLEIHGTADPIVAYQGYSAANSWPLPSVPDWLAGLASQDGCRPTPSIFLQTPPVTGQRWSGCRDKAQITHYRINGGGHSPPATIDGTNTDTVIWNFLTGHTLGR